MLLSCLASAYFDPPFEGLHMSHSPVVCLTTYAESQAYESRLLIQSHDNSQQVTSLIQTCLRLIYQEIIVGRHLAVAPMLFLSISQQFLCTCLLLHQYILHLQQFRTQYVSLLPLGLQFIIKVRIEVSLFVTLPTFLLVRAVCAVTF